MKLWKLSKKIISFEKNTGCDLLIVIAKSSNNYAVAPWRFGVLISCLCIMMLSPFINFTQVYYWSISVCLLLFSTIALGSLPPIKRFLITESEIDEECYENALKQFYTLGLSKVKHRVTAMIMVSLFERKITVLVDEKLKTQLTQAELDELVTIMQKHFKGSEMKKGWIESITSLEQKILKDFGGRVSSLDVTELSNQIYYV
jgi:uncharacterized membrane protein